MDTKWSRAMYLAIDVLLLLLVGLAVLLINLLAEPSQRGFYCNDESIQYPLHGSIVGTVTLGLEVLFLPIGLFAVTEYIRKRCKHTTGVATWLQISGVYLFGVGMVQLMVDTGKYMIGRLRPHFMAVCVPDYACNGTQNGGYVTDFTCLGTDASAVQDARKSFPSGHSAQSFYAAVFVIMYLQYLFTWNGSRLVRHVLQFVLLIGAWFTALSRVTDNHHHWSDVLAGIFLGSLAAVLNVVFVSGLRRASNLSTVDAKPLLNNDLLI